MTHRVFQSNLELASNIKNWVYFTHLHGYKIRRHRMKSSSFVTFCNPVEIQARRHVNVNIKLLLKCQTSAYSEKMERNAILVPPTTPTYVTYLLRTYVSRSYAFIHTCGIQ